MGKINARKKGHRYELDVGRTFNDLGWKCVTSRSESKRTDDAGVDLCYTDPFQIQAKAWERAPSYHALLANMPKGKINLVFHKRNHKGTVVAMKEEDFIYLLKLLIKHDIIKP
jgi:hypothetical protein